MCPLTTDRFWRQSCRSRTCLLPVAKRTSPPVDHGFEDLCGGIAREIDAANPEEAAPREQIAHRGIWVEPQLLAEIEYRIKPGAGKSAMFFQGLREDL
jgi:hypothetical protein